MVSLSRVVEKRSGGGSVGSRTISAKTFPRRSKRNRQNYPNSPRAPVSGIQKMLTGGKPVRLPMIREPPSCLLPAESAIATATLAVPAAVNKRYYSRYCRDS